MKILDVSYDFNCIRHGEHIIRIKLFNTRIYAASFNPEADSYWEDNYLNKYIDKFNLVKRIKHWFYVRDVKKYARRLRDEG